MFAIEIVDHSKTMSSIDISSRPFELLLDCPEAYVAWASQIIEEDKAAEFVVRGFGIDRRFPKLEFDYEGLMVLEDLPKAISCLRRRTDFEINLVSQAVESKLLFRCSANTSIVQVRCDTFSKDWQPVPELEEIEYTKLLGMLELCRDKFISIVKRLLPELFQHHLMQEWIAKFI